MHPPAEQGRPARFARAERWVHRATATMMMICLATALALYYPPVSQLIGRRRPVAVVHEWCGLLLPVPLLLGLVSRALRADLGRLNRFTPQDRVWLRAVLRRSPRRPAGKFNAGQKLYAAWIAGAVLVMIGTGLLMWFTDLAPLVWRTGATFVHDWLAAAIAVVVAGHVYLAVRDPEARRGMRTGSVDPLWATREHPDWDPYAGEPDAPPGPGGQEGSDGPDGLRAERDPG